MKKDTEILLVEDDFGHANLIRMYLEKFEISNQTIHFFDGQEILDFLFRNGSGPHRQSNTPYILLLDLRMPVVSGIEVIEKLKKETEFKNIPIVVISTTDDPAKMKKCLNLGCDRFVGKPVDPDEFAETMEKLAHYLNNLEVPRIQ